MAILIVIGVAVMMATYRLGFTRAFATGAFLSGISSIFFVLLGFISWSIASIFIIVLALGIALMRLSER